MGMKLFIANCFFNISNAFEKSPTATYNPDTNGFYFKAEWSGSGPKEGGTKMLSPAATPFSSAPPSSF